MSSKRCPKCGFVSFAAAGTCKRCGADLSASSGAATRPTPRREATGKKRSPLIVYIVGVFISLILGAFAFAATADRGTALPLSLFTGVFIGGMVLAVVIAAYLKKSGNAESQEPSATGRGYSKIFIYMFASFILLLPLLLLKLNNDNSDSDKVAEKIAELLGVCLAPAIIMALWMRFSKQKWSWLGVGLRYILIFLVFALSVVMNMLYGK